ncbi:MAG: hypothetical protein ACI920_000890, partial [Saprospiraceae bacterium]
FVNLNEGFVLLKLSDNVAIKLLIKGKVIRFFPLNLF